MLGAILWEGPSRIDGAPLVVIVTGFKASTNRKTGAMLQTYIMRRDMEPLDAMAAGLDTSICGDCKHRSTASGGEGTCYVNIGHGPRAVWDAYHRGRYVDLTGSPVTAARAIGATGRQLRIGSYGDPGAAPPELWALLAGSARGHTGYTHRWQDTGADLINICHASADSLADAESAWVEGWATFRVSAKGDATRSRWEAQCPASEAAGKKVTCESCPLKCDGGGFNIAIQAHGASAGRVN